MKQGDGPKEFNFCADLFFQPADVATYQRLLRPLTDTGNQAFKLRLVFSYGARLLQFSESLVKIFIVWRAETDAQGFGKLFPLYVLLGLFKPLLN